VNEAAGSPRISVVLAGVFFLSGATALLFETLWFRQAGLAVGNSVWATAVVLASFMAGLALGNALAARYGERVTRPIRAYAALEIAVSLSGVALVWYLPALGTAMAPLFRPLLEHPLLLNLLRLLVCFALLLVPSTAMGATLPLLVKALRRTGLGFGVALGRLYGFNTLGAVLGAVIGEGFAIERFGIRGTGLLAAGIGSIAAAAALGLADGRSAAEAADFPGRQARLPWRTVCGLWAAFLAGGLLLALEVVWFRFFNTLVVSTALVQSIMLATILLGIAVGGLAASRWLRADPDATRFLVHVALLAGVLTVATYAGFHHGDFRELAVFLRTWPEIVPPALRLMFPVSVASGVLFTLLGEVVRRDIRADTRAAGWLSMSNTLGAMLGSLLAGFVLLPAWGMERSLFGVALGYGAVAGLVSLSTRDTRTRRAGAPLIVASVGLYAFYVVLFPFGLMERHYFRGMIERYLEGGSHLVAMREGTSQTIAYLRNDFEDLGVPNYYRLITDGYSMSGTTLPGRRYMGLFVYLPVAIHPHPRRALLISYGVGVTAQALTDTLELERIDVVDTSADILDLSRVVFPDPTERPLSDPRVRVYVEDGRQYLQSTRQQYDIITGEPPPPKHKGVVSLYTREYFALIRSRLAAGGITTYWLPVHGVGVEDSYAIIRGFCDAFEDCSLWTGYPQEWMLVGTKGAAGPVSEERFAAQWAAMGSGRRLREIGVEFPGQLGSLFLGGPEDLERWTRDTLPLTDDYPYRLSMETSPEWLNAEAIRHGRRMNTVTNRLAFERSPLIARLWPAGMRSGTLPYFETRHLLDTQRAWLPPSTSGLDELYEILTTTRLRTLPLWMLGSSTSRLAAADLVAAQGGKRVDSAYWIGLGALVDRSYDAAATAFAAAMIERPSDPSPVQMRVLALALGGRTSEVRAQLDLSLRGDIHEPFREWLGRTLPDQLSAVH